MFVLILCMATRTWNRNRDWESEMTLYRCVTSPCIAAVPPCLLWPLLQWSGSVGVFPAVDRRTYGSVNDVLFPKCHWFYDSHSSHVYADRVSRPIQPKLWATWATCIALKVDYATPKQLTWKRWNVDPIWPTSITTCKYEVLFAWFGMVLFVFRILNRSRLQGFFMF